MKVLVTGATGFIGRELLPVLRERGHEVVVLTRRPSTAGVRLPVHCAVHAWNPAAEEPPPTAFAGVEAVVHLAGENVAAARWSEAQRAELARSRIVSTRRLVQAIQRQETRPRILVSASAIGVYGDRGDAVLDEATEPGAGFLAALCRDWEREIFSARDLGIRTVALRIGAVLGRGGGAMNKMLPLFRLCLGGRLGDGGQWMGWIHVRDVIGMILHALETPALQGAVNAVSPNPVTNRDFTRALAEALDVRACLPVPAWVLKLTLGGLEEILLASQRVRPAAAEAAGYRFQYPTLESALREICCHFDHEFRMEQWVPRKPEEVFPFFSEAKNLERLTPEFLCFRILGQSTETIGKGTRINYKLRVRGIPVRWQSRIAEWQPGCFFVDTQTSGPYAHWLHTHEFIPHAGGTILRDHVCYRLPFDTLTDPVAHPFVRRDLERIFLYRREQAEKLFG